MDYCTGHLSSDMDCGWRVDRYFFHPIEFATFFLVYQTKFAPILFLAVTPHSLFNFYSPFNLFFHLIYIFHTFNGVRAFSPTLNKVRLYLLQSL